LLFGFLFVIAGGKPMMILPAVTALNKVRNVPSPLGNASSLWINHKQAKGLQISQRHPSQAACDSS
jgi:hypothetical protein